MTTTRDGEALMAAILADPADDLPRLAYADWCEEDGDMDRAEFIRLGLANKGRQPHTSFGPVGLREHELLGSVNCLRRWLRTMPSLFGLNPSPYGDHGYNGNGTIKWYWERGFIHTICCKMDKWLEVGSAIVTEHPIGRVECIDAWPAMRDYGAGDDRWAWYRGYGGGVDHPGKLPPEVWKAMCPDAEADCHFVEFDTQDGANKALSDTLIRMAKGMQ